VLASGLQECNFCEFSEVSPREENPSLTRDKRTAISREEWRGELNQRLEAYRARRRKSLRIDAQPALPFEDRTAGSHGQVALEEHPPAAAVPSAGDDFAFTIAIGRTAQKESADPRVLIDVSSPPQGEALTPEIPSELCLPPQGGLFPVASLADRRRALLVDAACLAFAYGGFLGLFGSLGGHFTVSKLSAAVCFFTFTFVYLQYFGLFTIFGGSTPGMMLCGLQVASVTGDAPTPRQFLLRAAGYVLSAGTCFLGFLWVAWDEDGLTWHDRLSQTYLTNGQSFAEEDISHPATAR